MVEAHAARSSTGRAGPKTWTTSPPATAGPAAPPHHLEARLREREQPRGRGGVAHCVREAGLHQVGGGTEAVHLLAGERKIALGGGGGGEHALDAHGVPPPGAGQE